MNKDQIYLFKVKNEEQCEELFNAIDNSGIADTTNNPIRRVKYCCVVNNIVVHQGEVTHSPSGDSLSSGIWLDTEAFIEQYGFREHKIKGTVSTSNILRQDDYSYINFMIRVKREDEELVRPAVKELFEESKK